MIDSQINGFNRIFFTNDFPTTRDFITTAAGITKNIEYPVSLYKEEVTVRKKANIR